MDKSDLRATFDAGRIFSSLRAFDLYGNTVTLTINNQDASKSTVGTVLSILTMVVCFGLSWFSFISVIDETNATTNTSTSPGASSFDVNSSSLFFALTPFYSNNNKTYVMSSETNDYTLLKNMNEYYGVCRQCIKQEFPLVKCEMTIKPSKLKQITKMRAQNLSTIFTNSSMCLPIEFNTPLLNEDILSPTFSSFSIKISDNFLNGKSYTSESSTKQNKPLYQQEFSEEITLNKNFRLLVLHSHIEFNLTNNVSNVVDNSFIFKNLDFRNYITGVPLSYDVIVEKYNVSIERPYLFFFSQKEDVKSYYAIKDIELNNMKSNDLSRKYLRFNFRIHPIVTVVAIRSELFTDTLSIFGSYWCMFTLLGRVVASIWGGYFYRADLYNTVFRFHDNDPDYDPASELII